MQSGGVRCLAKGLPPLIGYEQRIRTEVAAIDTPDPVAVQRHSNGAEHEMSFPIE